MYGTPERPATGGYQTVSTNVPPTDGETPPPRPRVPIKKLATAALFSVLVTAAFLKADARNARRRAKQAAKEAKPELFDWTGFIPPAYGGAGELTATPSTSVAPTEYQPSAAPTIDTSYYVCCFPSYHQYLDPDYDPCTCDKVAKPGIMPALSEANCLKAKSYWRPARVREAGRGETRGDAISGRGDAVAAAWIGRVPATPRRRRGSSGPRRRCTLLEAGSRRRRLPGSSAVAQVPAAAVRCADVGAQLRAVVRAELHPDGAHCGAHAGADDRAYAGAHGGAHGDAHRRTHRRAHTVALGRSHGRAHGFPHGGAHAGTDCQTDARPNVVAARRA